MVLLRGTFKNSDSMSNDINWYSSSKISDGTDLILLAASKVSGCNNDDRYCPIL